MSHILSYALNHMVAPRKTFAELVELATALGLDQVEIRNDLPGVAITDGTPPALIREQAEAVGVKILSINGRAREAARLAGYARVLARRRWCSARSTTPPIGSRTRNA